ncbi:hypothetical protein C0Q70_02349 [Pomacea canaliculata]|uniref:Uncharacterized protein n=1 Tax=Pomacea canaliculata TaxID=400727 RepID=A0A2T7PPT5_POMCA|nr:hypothetical protein C0Q70_02349 [Pomacea canaliculata]
MFQVPILVFALSVRRWVSELASQGLSPARIISPSEEGSSRPGSSCTAYNTEETLAVSGQVMNRNNYRYVFKEILKAGNLQQRRLPDGFHNLLPPDQVKIFMTLLPKKLLKKGKKWTQDYLNSIQKIAMARKSTE